MDKWSLELDRELLNDAYFIFDVYQRCTSDRRTTGLVLLFAGVAFTTASILENDGAYGTWTKNPQPGNPYNQTYSTKPFIQQFPRNIMLFVGIGFTLTGGGIMINNK